LIKAFRNLDGDDFNKTIFGNQLQIHFLIFKEQQNEEHLFYCD
ncbi:unnamed protein product, partial [Rotaria socialis]